MNVLVLLYEARSRFSFNQARETAKMLLRQEERPTAVFCDDDLFAVGVYKAARELGLRIPEDLSVVDFDDIDIAQVLEPELTTIKVPAEEIGGRAIDKLLDLLAGKEQGVNEKIPLEIVIRESTSRCE